eukprot:Amastigsp_a181085_9.p3 type:complete len:171 gc:universal Amastigsp_a181085_9:1213-701(-)
MSGGRVKGMRRSPPWPKAWRDATRIWNWMSGSAERSRCTIFATSVCSSAKSSASATATASSSSMMSGVTIVRSFCTRATSSTTVRVRITERTRYCAVAERSTKPRSAMSSSKWARRSTVSMFVYESTGMLSSSTSCFATGGAIVAAVTSAASRTDLQYARTDSTYSVRSG